VYLSPEACPALVLNADHRPLSYYPLSLWPWQETVKAVFMDRVNILSEYDREVRSPGFRMRLPSVVSLKRYITLARRPAFTRFNVFLRDRFECQYCGDGSDLTFDHVTPRSKGGVTSWDNVVTACAHCNLRKGGRLTRECHMFPRRPPAIPSVFELQENGRSFPPRYLHETWRDYLYWDTELEP
jgi:5-methylcytosine-specific restriction endonuclease McrA